MKTKITAVALLAVTAGVFAYTRPHNAVPSDLRDAPRETLDSSAMNSLDKTAGASGMNIPEPAKAVNAESPTDDKAKEGDALLPGAIYGHSITDKNKVDRYVVQAKGISSEENALKGYNNLAMPPVGLDKSALDLISQMPGETLYEKVGRLFSQGSSATKRDLAGWHAGRVFYKDGHSEGGLLIGQATAPNAASLENTEGLFLVGMVFVLPDFFDNIRNYAYKREIVKMSMLDPYIYWEARFPCATAVMRKHTGNDGLLQMRKYNNYILERWQDARGVEVYSWYFKDVTPRFWQ